MCFIGIILYMNLDTFIIEKFLGAGEYFNSADFRNFMDVLGAEKSDEVPIIDKDGERKINVSDFGSLDEIKEMFVKAGYDEETIKRFHEDEDDGIVYFDI